MFGEGPDQKFHVSMAAILGAVCLVVLCQVLAPIMAPALAQTLSEAASAEPQIGGRKIFFMLFLMLAP